jgi:NADH-quinone oxidoreductase subunit L
MMTAAYMTRCVWLTFHGEPRGNAAHHHPHESPPAITGPLVVLAFLAVTSGWLNVPFFPKFGEWTFNEVLAHAGVPEHHFSYGYAAGSTLIALLGVTAGALYYFRSLGPRGLTERSRLARAGYVFLENKYFLDTLYTQHIVGSIKGPIARAAYWINQNVIDGVVNGVGIASRALANFVYDVIDQKVVDGAVNGAGLTAEEGGAALRVLQTGRVQNYAAVMFGVVAVSALALAIFVSR